MGGWSSTRWNGVRTRTVAGDCLQLRPRDVRDALRRLDQDEAPSAGYKLKLTWSDTYGSRSSIGADVVRLPGERPFLQLRYVATSADGASEHIAERVTLDPQRQQGASTGRRWWLRCPRCGRRCGVIYLPPSYRRWACRVCYQLTYQSSNTSDKRISRAVRALQHGDGIPVIGGASVSTLGVYLQAFDVYRTRLRRALRRDLGAREYKRHYGWLEPGVR